MRIWIKGYLGLQAALADRPFIELDADRVRLRDLLGEIARQSGEDLAQAIKDLDAQGTERRLVILVNGRHISHLPDRLDTRLKEGDQVAIFPPVAGG
jgi:MoaD family protein